MKRIFIIAASVLMFSGIAAAASKKLAQPVEPSQVLLLYPKGQDVDEGIIENGKAVTAGPLDSNGYTADEERHDSHGSYYKTSAPSIAIYHPKKSTGKMVVVCPGGGYMFASYDNEGRFVADWFVKQGFDVCVVKYREPDGHWTIPLQDIQNAFRYCRAHSVEWGVKQIGVIGFSAGGHLAASVSTLYVDEITRPDFSILVYPVITMDLEFTHRGTRYNLLGEDSKWLDKKMSVEEYEENKAQLDSLVEHYSLERRVDANTPKTFIAVSTGDTTVPVENSLMYYKALSDNKVSAEMHIYPVGGHGWGFSRVPLVPHDNLGEYRPVFEADLANWLKKL